MKTFLIFVTSDGQYNRDVTAVHMHPEYGSQNGINNDFCLLETVNLNLNQNADKADIACLPEQGKHVLPRVTHFQT